jgi:hypothetical protein
MKIFAHGAEFSFSFPPGVAQGIITGIRGLCNGLGPAMFGCVFYLFHVNLNENLVTTSTPKPDNITSPAFSGGITLEVCFCLVCARACVCVCVCVYTDFVYL